MTLQSKRRVPMLLLAMWGWLGSPLLADPPPQPAPAATLRAELLAAHQVNDDQLQAAREAGRNAIVLELAGDRDDARRRELAAAQTIRQSGLDLYYWIEVARCPQLAAQHPRWMASLQGHREWRRLFPEAPEPASDEVVKVYPWVPVLTEEGFQGQLKRVVERLREMPTARGVLLNDLQGAPSACGCGNTFCRWTTDYGPIRTAAHLGPDAAARFAAEVGKRVPGTRVIPVWVTECEEHDGAADGLCAGVGCFKGICWKAYTKQLMPVVERHEQLAVLLPFRALGRDVPHYGRSAGWIAHALATFESMPPRHGGKAVPASRLIAVLQGWEVDAAAIAAQIREAERGETAGYVVARCRLDQSWQPQIIKWK